MADFKLEILSFDLVKQSNITQSVVNQSKVTKYTNE